MNYENMAVTVSQVNSYIKEKIASDEGLNNLIIKGEISNFKNHYTGHMYFTLKDDKSLIKCIMFKTYAQRLNFMPKDGMKVFVFGEVSVFERDGIYQVYAKAMQEDGVGALYKQYEKLKQELEEKGYFDISHKKKIPQMPKVIGVLTSQTGSVIRDIINVSTRRNPNVQIRLLPVPVQGQDAAPKIAEGIRFMNKNKLADVLILARGGGSLEDLWPFNEEIVAQAIYESELPIISAVGHETDFSISDFVSDLRAPTPSAAAELAVPSMLELQYQIQANRKQLKTRMAAILQQKQQQWSEQQKLLSAAAPEKRIVGLKKEVQANRHRLQQQMHKLLQEKQFQLQLQQTKLESNHPNRILSKGYAIVRHGQQILSHADAVQAGDVLTIQLAHGTISVQVLAQEEET